MRAGKEGRVGFERFGRASSGVCFRGLEARGMGAFFEGCRKSEVEGDRELGGTAGVSGGCRAGGNGEVASAAFGADWWLLG